MQTSPNLSNINEKKSFMPSEATVETKKGNVKEVKKTETVRDLQRELRNVNMNGKESVEKKMEQLKGLAKKIEEKTNNSSVREAIAMVLNQSNKNFDDAYDVFSTALQFLSAGEGLRDMPVEEQKMTKQTRERSLARIKSEQVMAKQAVAKELKPETEMLASDWGKEVDKYQTKPHELPKAEEHGKLLKEQKKVVAEKEELPDMTAEAQLLEPTENLPWGEESYAAGNRQDQQKNQEGLDEFLAKEKPPIKAEEFDQAYITEQKARKVTRIQKEGQKERDLNAEAKELGLTRAEKYFADSLSADKVSRLIQLTEKFDEGMSAELKQYLISKKKEGLDLRQELAVLETSKLNSIKEKDKQAEALLKLKREGIWTDQELSRMARFLNVPYNKEASEEELEEDFFGETPNKELLEKQKKTALIKDTEKRLGQIMSKFENYTLDQNLVVEAQQLGESLDDVRNGSLEDIKKVRKDIVALDKKVMETYAEAGVKEAVKRKKQGRAEGGREVETKNIEKRANEILQIVEGRYSQRNIATALVEAGVTTLSDDVRNRLKEKDENLILPSNRALKAISELNKRAMEIESVQKARLAKEKTEEIQKETGGLVKFIKKLFGNKRKDKGREAA